MFLEEKSQSVIELVLHQLIPLSIASATLLTIVGTFLVAKVLQPFLSEYTVATGYVGKAVMKA